MTKDADQIRQALEVPFGSSDVKWRAGAYGKQLAYLDGPTVYRRLNESTNSWDFEIAKSYFDDMFTKDGEVIKVMVVEGHLTIPELGKRAGTGVQILNPGSGEDMYKGARTDAIKNAASLFGVGLNLYDDSPAPTQQHQAPQRSQQGGNGSGQQVNQQNANMATAPQKSRIQRLAGDLRMSPDELNAVIQQSTGSSFEGMNKRQASGVIDLLEDRRNQAAPSAPRQY